MNIGSIGSAMMLAKDTAEQMRIKARGTELEKRLLEAMSNENWGASSSLLNQLAQDTYDYDKYPIIMKQIWHAMDNTAASWRKVFKALSLLEHLIKNGNERIVEETRDHMRKVRMLTDFNFYEGPIDRGSGIREKSKNIIELLQDNDRIREERSKARQLREKFQGGAGPSSNNYNGGGYGNRDNYSGGGGGYQGNGGGFNETGSYSSGGIGSSSFDQGRGGREPPRRSYEGNGRTQGYSDSGPSSSGPSRSSGGIGRYDDEPVSKPQPKKEVVSNKKFDIKIKGAGDSHRSSSSNQTAPKAPPPVTKAPEPEPDLFGLDTPGFSSNTAPVAPASDFDAFSAAPPAPPAADFGDFTSAGANTQNNAAGFSTNFDAFAGNNAGFDANFNTPPPQPNGGMGQPMNGGMGQPMNGGMGQPMNGGMGQPMNGGMGQPMNGGMGQPMNGGMGQPMNGGMGQPMNGGMGQPMNGGMGQPMNGGMGQPMNGGMGQPMNGGMGQPMNGGMSQQQQQNEFGDFQQVQAPVQQTPPKKAAPELSLVDFGGITLNDNNKDKKAGNAPGSADKSKFKAHNSFDGLDGFNTTPMGSMGGGMNRGMGQPMGGQSMGGMMGQPMGQMNRGGGQPMGQPMNGGMGQPMGGMNQQYGQPMGGMNQQYGQPMGGQGMMGQPMGQMGGQQPQYQMGGQPQYQMGGQQGMQQQWSSGF